MNYYKIESIDFVDMHDGNFELVDTQDDLVFVKSSKKLKAPFVEASEEEREWLEANEKLALNLQAHYKIVEINKKCDERLTSFTSDALGEIYTYDLKQEDQINYLGLMLANQDAFIRCYKVDEEGKIIGTKANLPHTAAQIQKVYADGSAYKMAMIEKCGVLKARVDEAKTHKELREIQWTDE